MLLKSNVATCFPYMKGKMKDLTVRSVSGAVFLVIFVGAILLSQWSFGALLLAILIGGQIEYYRMCSRSGYSPQVFTGVVCGLALLVINFLIFKQFGRVMAIDESVSKAIYVLMLYVVLILPTVFVCELLRGKTNPIADVGTTIAGVVYVALPLSLLCYIPLLLNGGTWNPWALLGYVLIIWANDVFAYLVGSTFGKHLICERISPKKTWEGFAGGFTFSLISGLAAGYLLGGNLWIWGGMAVVASVTGVMGDFTESMFKRSVGVKDSGAMMPGHGGWLDRFDSMLMSAPYVFVYLLITCN